MQTRVKDRVHAGLGSATQPRASVAARSRGVDGFRVKEPCPEAADLQWPPLAPELRFCKPAESIGLPSPVGPDNLAFKFGGSLVRGAEGGARRAAHAQNGLPVPRGLCSRGERRSARRGLALERGVLLRDKAKRRHGGTLSLQPAPAGEGSSAVRPSDVISSGTQLLPTPHWKLFLFKQVRQWGQPPRSPALFSATVCLVWSVFPGFWVLDGRLSICSICVSFPRGRRLSLWS